MQGTIRKLVLGRGYGFILSEEGQEIFFHQRSLKGLEFDRLEGGEVVEYEAQPTHEGMRALSVRPREAPPT